jgi:Amt family ammonium transporter
VVLGAVAGALCYYACTVKNRFGYDDALDAFGVHGVGGTAGALLTGVFATRSIVYSTAGKVASPTPQGLLEGNVQQFVNQGIGVLAAMALAVIGTVALLKLLDAVMGLRVTQQQELQGLDLSQHGEEGYIFL